MSAGPRLFKIRGLFFEITPFMKVNDAHRKDQHQETSEYDQVAF